MSASPSTLGSPRPAASAKLRWLVRAGWATILLSVLLAGLAVASSRWQFIDRTESSEVGVGRGTCWFGDPVYGRQNAGRGPGLQIESIAGWNDHWEWWWWEWRAQAHLQVRVTPGYVPPCQTFFPAWAPMTVLAVSGVALLVPGWRLRCRVARGQCLGCGYSREGLPTGSGACPECGSSFAPEQGETQ